MASAAGYLCWNSSNSGLDAHPLSLYEAGAPGWSNPEARARAHPRSIGCLTLPQWVKSSPEACSQAKGAQLPAKQQTKSGSGQSHTSLRPTLSPPSRLNGRAEGKTCTVLPWVSTVCVYANLRLLVPLTPTLPLSLSLSLPLSLSLSLSLSCLHGVWGGALGPQPLRSCTTPQCGVFQSR